MPVIMASVAAEIPKSPAYIVQTAKLGRGFEVDEL